MNEFVLVLLLAIPQEDFPPMAVFRQYYDRLAHGVQDPVSLACKLFSKQLVSREERDQVITPQNATPLCRTTTLLGAVECRIAAEQTSRPLTVFCQALEKSPGLCVVADEMKKNLGRY